jgi:hypothetical protein
LSGCAVSFGEGGDGFGEYDRDEWECANGFRAVCRIGYVVEVSMGRRSRRARGYELFFNGRTG